MSIVDLENFQFVISSRAGEAMMYHGIAWHKEMPRLMYAVYTDPCYAAAEWAYGRLCEYLNLPYVHVMEGINLKSVKSSPLVSASVLNHTWTTYQDWSTSRRADTSLINRNNLSQFTLLHILSQNSSADINGYVSGPEPYFIGANNGGAFFAQGTYRTMAAAKEGYEEHQITSFASPAIHAFLSTLPWSDPQTEILLQKIAALNDAQLTEICSFPSQKELDSIRVDIMRKLLNMRNIARQAID